MAKYEDHMMDDMVASDEPLVPRVDKYAGQDRWGVDTPMFESKSDMHEFLQTLGMAPGGLPADFLDAALYMSEGEFAEGMTSLGAAVPILGSVGRGYKLLGKTAKGRRVDSFLKSLDEKFKKYEGEHAALQEEIKCKSFKGMPKKGLFKGPDGEFYRDGKRVGFTTETPLKYDEPPMGTKAKAQKEPGAASKIIDYLKDLF